MPFQSAVNPTGHRGAQGNSLRISHIAACLVWVAPLAFGQTSTNASIGRMMSAVGTVTLESGSGAPRLASADTELRVGDVVQTQAGSSAALRYMDGTNIQLGQRSRMTITEFAVNAEQPADERFVARLLVGAMRVITGLVAKRRPTNARFSTSTATVGIRGTDFVMRECNADCIPSEPTSALSREAARASEDLAGRMAASSAPASAASVSGAARPLQAKAAFRVGETLTTAATAALFVLRDGTRIALDPNSALTLRAFEFDEAMPANGRIALTLVRGKVQIVAGQIARARAEQMSVAIGAVLLRPAALAEFGVALQPGTSGELVQVAVTTASVAVQGGVAASAPTRVDAGTTVTLQSGGSPVTGGTLSFESASPGSATVDSAQLFGQSAAPLNGPARAGTYVFVTDGAVALSQGGIELPITPGETGFASVAGGPIELVANGSHIAGITALGLQSGGSDQSCRASP